MSAIDTTDAEKRIAERVNQGAVEALGVSTITGGVGFSKMTDAMEFAKLMAISTIAIPKHLRGNVGACLAVTIQAIEWKCSPFAVANKSYLVNDRLAYESQLIQAVILQRAPIKGRFAVKYTGEGDAKRCAVQAVLREGGVVDYTSPEFGRIPIKNSPLWKNDPEQQLFYYSARALCRRHFPDVLLGIYTPEELAAEVSEPIDVTPPRAKKGLAAKLDAIAEPTIINVASDEAEEIIEQVAAVNDVVQEHVHADIEFSPISAAHANEEAALLDAASAKAQEGSKKLRWWIAKLRPDQRELLKPHMGELESEAAKVKEKSDD